MKRRAVILVILANIVYGCSFMMTSIAIAASERALFGLLAARFLIAFLALAALAACGAVRVRYRGKPVWKLLGISLLYPGLYFFSEAMALTQVSSAVVGVVIGVAPITTALLTALLFRRRQSGGQLAFMVLSVAGVAAVNGLDTQGLSPRAVLFLALALLSFSAYSIGIHSAGREFTSAEITLFMMFSGMVIFHLLDAVSRGPLACVRDLAKPSFLLPVLVLGVVTSALSSLALNEGLCRLPPVTVSVLNNVTSLVAVLCGVFFLGEAVTARVLAGCGLILAGCTGYSLLSSDTGQEHP